ncbi:MAG: acyltransferase, partial [Sphingomonadales bacterium]|nr:acyltransferase [Sphingomonadales bacterium]
FETEGEGEIVIGSHVRINDGCTIVAHQRVTIGDDTLIGEFASIRDANHGMATSALIRMQPNVALPVLIGGNVWIGRGACVLMGACLEDGVVVGANSVVTQRISENSIVAGVPARRISNRVDRQ